MSRYILDTDCFSLWQQNHPMMVQRVELNAENLAVTIVTVEEVIRGWFDVIRQASAPPEKDKKAKKEKKASKPSQADKKASEPSQADKLVWGYTKLWDTLEDFKNLNILKFDRNASTIYTKFHPQIRLIGSQDLRIAAIVLANNAILVTRNHRHFSQVPDLVQEDWTIQP
ncbi:type II toxin-antitoxin system VapC family toxin [Microcoleus sp. OTE_8_concoct_300]|uniref:type II toxin-antitoxin system VapC family toxin n=1 Tax=Microcoleus sp. OTE_8_concoct_300 TaxID=2964710 RepID=UPI00403F2CEC